MEKRYIYSLIVQNRAGVLSRIAGLLTRRGFNIETCSAAETDNPGISLIVVVFRSDEMPSRSKNSWKNRWMFTRSRN